MAENRLFFVDRFGGEVRVVYAEGLIVFSGYIQINPADLDHDVALFVIIVIICCYYYYYYYYYCNIL